MFYDFFQISSGKLNITQPVVQELIPNLLLKVISMLFCSRNYYFHLKIATSFIFMSKKHYHTGTASNPIIICSFSPTLGL